MKSKTLNYFIAALLIAPYLKAADDNDTISLKVIKEIVSTDIMGCSSFVFSPDNDNYLLASSTGFNRAYVVDIEKERIIKVEMNDYLGVAWFGENILLLKKDNIWEIKGIDKKRNIICDKMKISPFDRIEGVRSSISINNMNYIPNDVVVLQNYDDINIYINEDGQTRIKSNLYKNTFPIVQDQQMYLSPDKVKLLLCHESKVLDLYTGREYKLPQDDKNRWKQYYWLPNSVDLIAVGYKLHDKYEGPINSELYLYNIFATEIIKVEIPSKMKNTVIGIKDISKRGRIAALIQEGYPSEKPISLNIFELKFNN